MLKKVFPILLGAGIGFAAAKIIEKMNECDLIAEEDEDEISAGYEDTSDNNTAMINSNNPQSSSDNNQF